jgi:elongation factor 1 alpha-like protein
MPPGLKSKQATAKTGGDKKTQGDLTGSMKSLSVEEPVKVKSKNLDVLAEYKKSQHKNAANFVVIGGSVFFSVKCFLTC